VTYPPLWIDKCLYTPTLIVQAALEAASTIDRQIRRSHSTGEDHPAQPGERVRVIFT
jgi:hypothetical protein